MFIYIYIYIYTVFLLTKTGQQWSIWSYFYDKIWKILKTREISYFIEYSLLHFSQCAPDLVEVLSRVWLAVLWSEHLIGTT